ncbi:hypothetical protein [uncultured Adlercreutzia sp.]|uniref:hypothetical protein n=1 Tax=uncultured Adlercreutzia sp. TaxID=875803 RepID=UPI0026F3A173|nr:hypothetical protein [uncultured Adlercreutzia sp.]
MLDDGTLLGWGRLVISINIARTTRHGEAWAHGGYRQQSGKSNSIHARTLLATKSRALIALSRHLASPYLAETNWPL